MFQSVEALQSCVQPAYARTLSSPAAVYDNTTDQLSHVSATLPACTEYSFFLGREREMAAMQTALEHVLAGHGQLALIAGEPGIGKTHLLEAFAHLARQRQVRVFWGRCWEGDGALAFWPWVQIVRAYVQDCPPTSCWPRWTSSQKP